MAPKVLNDISFLFFYLKLQFEVLSEALSLTNVTLLGDGGCEADEEGQSGKGLHPVERQGLRH